MRGCVRRRRRGKRGWEGWEGVAAREHGEGALRGVRRAARRVGRAAARCFASARATSRIRARRSRAPTRAAARPQGRALGCANRPSETRSAWVACALGGRPRSREGCPRSTSRRGLPVHPSRSCARAASSRRCASRRAAPRDATVACGLQSRGARPTAARWGCRGAGCAWPFLRRARGVCSVPSLVAALSQSRRPAEPLGAHARKCSQVLANAAGLVVFP